MPKDFNPNDLSILKGTVSVEGGVYKVVTRVAGHKPGDIISKDRAIELAEFMTYPDSELYRELLRVPMEKESYTECIHGNHPANCDQEPCYFDDYDD